MDLTPLRQLALEINFDTHGIPITVNPVDGFPVETTGIWLVPETEQLPGTSDFQKSNARRVMAIRSDLVPLVPRKSTINVPRENLLDEVWSVDAVDTIDRDHYHLTLVRTS